MNPETAEAQEHPRPPRERILHSSLTAGDRNAGLSGPAAAPRSPRIPGTGSKTALAEGLAPLGPVVLGHQPAVTVGGEHWGHRGLQACPLGILLGHPDSLPLGPSWHQPRRRRLWRVGSRSILGPAPHGLCQPCALLALAPASLSRGDPELRALATTDIRSWAWPLTNVLPAHAWRPSRGPASFRKPWWCPVSTRGWPGAGRCPTCALGLQVPLLSAGAGSAAWQL